MVRTPESGH